MDGSTLPYWEVSHRGSAGIGSARSACQMSPLLRRKVEKAKYSGITQVRRFCSQLFRPLIRVF